MSVKSHASPWYVALVNHNNITCIEVYSKLAKSNQKSCTLSMSSPLRHLTGRQAIGIPYVSSRRLLKQETNALSMAISRSSMKRCPPIIPLGGILKEILIIRNSIDIVPSFNKDATNLKATVAGRFVKGTSVTDLSAMFQQ